MLRTKTQQKEKQAPRFFFWGGATSPPPLNPTSETFFVGWKRLQLQPALSRQFFWLASYFSELRGPKKKNRQSPAKWRILMGASSFCCLDQKKKHAKLYGETVNFCIFLCKFRQFGHPPTAFSHGKPGFSIMVFSTRALAEFRPTLPPARGKAMGDFLQRPVVVWGLYRGFPKMVGFPPNHPILIGFSILNHPFWDTTILGNPHTLQ